MTVTIETGIPLPPRGGSSFGSGINLTETLKKLKVGQSFLLDDQAQRRSIFGCARRIGIKAATRFDKETGKVRVFRTA